MLMFHQVQRAFRSSMTQTDVMESGRAVMDMLVRDLEEMAPLQLPYYSALDPNYYSLNFMVGMTSDFGTPLLQDLPGTTGANGPWRSNVVEQFYFTTKSNQTFMGTGYRVIADYTNTVTPSVQAGLGTLYRYTISTNKYWAGYLQTNYFIASRFTTNMHRIADGIVHLQLRVFDTNGAPMFANNTNSLAFWTFTNAFLGGSLQPQVTTVPMRNAFATNDYFTYGPPIIPNQQYMEYWFYSNAVPAYIELEMGIVEPRTLEHYRAIAEADVGAARTYLAKHAANVHLFRQRIPIRAVDYMAYQ
jgi:hypothetical protein